VSVLARTPHGRDMTQASGMNTRTHLDSMLVMAVACLVGGTLLLLGAML
jgi:hypothetical protein